MAARNQGGPNMDMFDAYFRAVDLDRDGRISSTEAVAFFQGSNLTKHVLAQIWNYANHNRTGYLGRMEFYNALKLVTVAQSKQELTPEIVKAALYGLTYAKIPAPQIKMASTPVPQTGSVGVTPASQTGIVGPMASQNPGFRGAPMSPSSNMNLQYNQSAVSGLVRQPNATSSVVATCPVQGVGFQEFPRRSSALGPNLPNSRVPSDTGGANVVGGSVVMRSEGGSPLTNQAGLPSGASSPMASLPPKPPIIPGMTASTSSDVQSKPTVPQNGFSSGSLSGGDVFTATPSQPKRDYSMPLSPVRNVPISSAFVLISEGTQSIFKQGPVNSLPNSLSVQSVGGQNGKMQPLPKSNQQVLVQNISLSGPPAVSPNNSALHQSQLQWPRPTQTDL